MIGTSNIDWAKVLAALAGLGGVLYYILQRLLDDRLAKRMEQTKHELQTEAQKLSIVFEHQKDSFRAILSAMHGAMRKIEDNIKDDGGDWLGIAVEDFDEFKRLVFEERLFVDATTERALSLFIDILWGTVESARFDQYPESDQIRRAYSQLEFIAGSVAEYFRMRVGLIPETKYPLLETELLGACRLINTYQFHKAEMPTKSVLSYSRHQSAGETVELARKNVPLLKTELIKLRQAADERRDGSRVFYSLVTKIDYYLSSFDSAGL